MRGADAPPSPGIRARLLCAKRETSWCCLTPGRASPSRVIDRNSYSAIDQQLA